uniref:Uncharacterized protein n=1 Tax=Pyrodinium bahamense TaxID=73915 RepID=A0A7R9ZZC4_9DINO
MGRRVTVRLAPPSWGRLGPSGGGAGLHPRRRGCGAAATPLLAATLLAAAATLKEGAVASWQAAHPAVRVFAALPADAMAVGADGAPRANELQAHSQSGVARRGALLAGALAPAIATMPVTLAEEVAGGGAPASIPVAAQSVVGAKLQRVLVNVGDTESLEKEVKFWTDACQMKVLNDATGKDGKRAVVLGFGPDRSSFGLELKVDPEVLKRPRPRLLNYEVLQPTVPSLNYMQVGAVGKIIEIFGRVQNAGGSSLIGDASYIDVESPRGVAVRMVPRTTTPSVELVSFNVEVPAFEATTKFYKRAIGLKEIRYSDSEPPVQKLSTYLASDIGGPNLLLSPVPDGRLKDRKLDEFDGVLLVAPSAADVAKAASSAVALAAEEEAAKEEEIKRQRQAAKESGEKAPSLKKFLSATKARPSVQMVDKMARIDDGLGTLLFVKDQADFERTFA